MSVLGQSVRGTGASELRTTRLIAVLLENLSFSTTKQTCGVRPFKRNRTQIKSLVPEVEKA